MTDALLSPVVGTGFWAGTITVIGVASRKVREKILLEEKLVPFMGVLAAFIFAGQMINFTIPGTGSSGHIGGGMILAILLGPHAGFLAVASVLTVQALFFADGGILALGCNIWNLGFYPCYVAYPLIYRTIAKERASATRLNAASVISAIAALQLGAFSVVLQTVLSARSELPFYSFLLVMQPIHLVIGVVEGFVTAGVVGYIRTTTKETRDETAVPAYDIRRYFITKKFLIRIAAATLVVGAFMSWFASTNPDGLEWSLKHAVVSNKIDMPEPGSNSVVKGIQKNITLLPDYGFKNGDSKNVKEGVRQSWPNVDAGRSLSGILGGVIVLGFVLGIGLLISKRKKKL